MTTRTIDVCGLSCPEPVIQTQEALKGLESGDSLLVIVDTVTSRENITRMAMYKGWQVNVKAENDRFQLRISKK